MRVAFDDEDASPALAVPPEGTAAAAAAAALAALDWFFAGEGATESVCCCCWAWVVVFSGCDAQEPSFPDFTVVSSPFLVARECPMRFFANGARGHTRRTK